MFSMIISEKGGAERREAFDKSEINVGRVQDNDVMLPKGNVSKHHARLMLRDGRVIVTDLKSTNGTYVNGRKIAQATIVRTGDKINIGDFVLRLETEAVAQVESTDSGDGGAVKTLEPAEGSESRPAEMAVMRLPTAQAPARSAYLVDAPLVSPHADSSNLDSGPPVSLSGSKGLGPAATQPVGPRGLEAFGAVTGPRAGPVAGPVAAPALDAVSTRVPSVAEREPMQGAGRDPSLSERRLALARLVARVSERGDFVALGPLESAEVSLSVGQAVREMAQAEARGMGADGEVAPSMNMQAVVDDAYNELVGVGPFASLLSDADVSEVHCARFDQVFAARGQRTSIEPVAFTSEASLKRAMARLADRSGEPWREGETLVERAWRGVTMVAFAPPLTEQHSVSILKGQRTETSLSALVSGGSLSTQMAHFLELCVVERANVLVVGTDPYAVVAALAGAANPSERSCLIHGTDEISVPGANITALRITEGGRGGYEAFWGAVKIRPRRTFVTQLGSGVATAMILAAQEGAQGLFVAAKARSLEEGLSRVATQAALGSERIVSQDFASAVHATFDVALECRTVGGRMQVARIVEMCAMCVPYGTQHPIRDLFTRRPDGTFAATGHVPAWVVDLEARGVSVDQTLFAARSEDEPPPMGVAAPPRA